MCTFSWDFFFILMQFSTFCDAYTIHKQYAELPQMSVIHSFLLLIIYGSNFLNYSTHGRQNSNKLNDSACLDCYWCIMICRKCMLALHSNSQNMLWTSQYRIIAILQSLRGNFYRFLWRLYFFNFLCI